MNSRYTIKVDDLRGPDIIKFLNEHLRSLAEVSLPCSMHALDLEKLRRPEITFWSVWDGPQLVGCGALKQLTPKHGEVKSMRTAHGHLRRGVASATLSQILSEAKARRYERLSLETGAGAAFHPAHALYRKFGFTECGPFADYEDDANSVFMTMEL